ncbi:hypothetical protein ACJRO7_008796 [Eucalyptus globulus]|uniref:CCHC-type domain-containing protein n=1 Tax=Eucalyptus globulus TaxID=34317 RepID=A0ABD3ISP6_EUCGL
MSLVTRGRTPIRVGTQGGHGQAQAEASASGVAPPPVDAGVAAPGDPRIDGILQMLEAMGNRLDQQAQNQAAAITVAVAAATAAAPAIAPAAATVAAPVVAPAEVPPGNVVAGRPMHKLVEHFLKLNPPKFTGSGDPEAAALWTKGLEKAFALLMCTEVEKVSLAVYQLEAAREVKMVEFQRLRQGTMTVDQYEAKFTELSRYAPELVENLVNRVKRFRDGLKPELRSSLILLNLRNYNDLYKWVQMIERDQNERAAASGSRFGSNREGNRFGKKPMYGGRYHVPPNRKGGIGKSTPNQNSVCRFCGRRHGMAPCHLRTGAYYECGQQGHIARDCPRKPRGHQQLPPPLPLPLGQNRGFVP